MRKPHQGRTANLTLYGYTSIENGKIAQIAPEISPREDDKVIDATGLVLLPGVIDTQVHFREPGLDHKEDLFTASLACAKGGVASFLKISNTKVVNNYSDSPR